MPTNAKGSQWMESVCPVRLYSLHTCWFEVGRDPNGSWGTEFKQERTPTPSCCTVLAQQNFGGELRLNILYVCLRCAYLGSNSAFLAPGPKPAGGLIHSGTHLLGESGRLNHRLRKKKNDMVNQYSCYNWIRKSPGVSCTSCLKTLRSHCDHIQQSQWLEVRPH